MNKISLKPEDVVAWILSLVANLEGLKYGEASVMEILLLLKL